MAEQIDPISGQFSIADRGGNYLDRLNLMLSKLNQSIGQYNNAVQAGEDATTVLAAVQQIQTDLEGIEQNVSVIAQGDLPAQTGKANRAFITDGTTADWQHLFGCNRFAAANITLAADDRALVTCIGSAYNATLPATIAAGQPIFIANEMKSDSNLSLGVPAGAGYSVAWDANTTFSAGQSWPLVPGEWAELQAVDTTTLKVVRKNAVQKPIHLQPGDTFDVPENQERIVIVCLGDATINLPDVPATKGFYRIKSTSPTAQVLINTAAGENTHQIDRADGETYDSAELNGLYQLDLHWLGAGIYRGF